MSSSLRDQTLRLISVGRLQVSEASCFEGVAPQIHQLPEFYQDVSFRQLSDEAQRYTHCLHVAIDVLSWNLPKAETYEVVFCINSDQSDISKSFSSLMLSMIT